MSGSVVIITSPDGGGDAPIRTKTRVTIEYTPDDNETAEELARVTEELQREADHIVKKHG